ncbi:hypothetical protein CVT26_004694 [Gymnopilus dilepis]|uniref:Uncharacterized protein n=1 Tax=Gymnopilus dilepis TaxID=231916 RepID=A0A409XZ59_9AGAR|nr:hypothetical protein CVT26_004694 [Gymnopilus dilepis]
MSPREDNPNYPGIEGVWFKVTDKDGNDVDLSPYSPQPVKMKNGEPAQIVVDDNDSHLGWYPINALKSGDGTVQQFKFIMLELLMGMNSSKDYTVSDDNSPGPLDDGANMDYSSVGLSRNQPLSIAETPDKTTDDGDGNKTGQDDNNNEDDGTKDPRKGTTQDDDNGTDNGNKNDNNNNTNTNNSEDEDKGRRKPKSKRDYYPSFPGVKGFWFQVIDINGNSQDLSNDFKYWDKAGSQTDLAWLPIKGSYTALALKKRVLKRLTLKISKYGVYNDDNDSVPYDDNSGDVDLEHNGLKKKKPLIFKEFPDDDGNESDESSGNNSSGSDDEMPPPDNPDYIANNSSSDDEMPPPDNPDYIANTSSQDYANPDPYRFFTRRIQCMSNADWSRYEGSIQNTYQGEILWTDGNLSYGVANMMAYMAVRRVPNTPTGNVVAVGQAAYFVYLG